MPTTTPDSDLWCVLVKAPTKAQTRELAFILGSKPRHTQMTLPEAERFAAGCPPLSFGATIKVVNHQELRQEFGDVQAELMLHDAGWRHRSVLQAQREEVKYNQQLKERDEE